MLATKASSHLSQVVETVLWTVLGVAFVALVFFSGGQLRVFDPSILSDADFQKAVDRGRISRPALNLVTLGNADVYIDFKILAALQEFARPPRISSERFFAVSIKPVLDLAPRHETFYMLACLVMADDFKKPERCSEISHVGMTAVRDGWRIPMMQGYVENNLLKQPGKASVYYETAAQKNGAPNYLRSAAAKLLSQDPTKEKIISIREFVDSLQKEP